MTALTQVVMPVEESDALVSFLGSHRVALLHNVPVNETLLSAIRRIQVGHNVATGRRVSASHTQLAS